MVAIRVHVADAPHIVGVVVKVWPVRLVQPVRWIIGSTQIVVKRMRDKEIHAPSADGIGSLANSLQIEIGVCTLDALVFACEAPAFKVRHRLCNLEVQGLPAKVNERIY